MTPEPLPSFAAAADDRPRDLIPGPAGADVSDMANITFDDSDGTWVRLARVGATVSLDRWPGPHGPGHVIHTSARERFCFERFDTPADGIPEAVYRAAPR